MALIFATSNSGAHHSPEETIAILTEKIETAPNPADLTQRAAEWIILSSYRNAQQDLEQALTLDGHFWTAHLALAEVQGETNQFEEGLVLIEAALKKFDTQHARRAFYQLQSRLYEENGEFSKSLNAIQSAIQLGSSEMDDLVRRSRLQAALNLPFERLKDLETAMSGNPGIVLKNEYIDALIDADQLDKALPLIEKRLAKTRRKSAWLIRRAKIYQQKNHATLALEDLRSAEFEIQTLLNPDRPHIGLLIELGQIYEMTDRPDDARHIQAQLKRL
jgi:tetratricopeptide (TPR) repeat protein